MNLSHSIKSSFAGIRGKSSGISFFDIRPARAIYFLAYAFELMLYAARGQFLPIGSSVLGISGFKLNVDIRTSHKLVSISDGFATVEDIANGSTVDLPCDNVVLALGSVPRTSIVNEIQSAFPDAIVIGDAVAGRRIMEATAEGYARGLTVRAK